MPRGRVPSGGKAPFCADCGSAVCGWVAEQHAWLCGSCEVLRNDPEAKRSTHPPGLPSTWRRDRGKPQNETLFDTEPKEGS